MSTGDAWQPRQVDSVVLPKWQPLVGVRGPAGQEQIVGQYQTGGHQMPRPANMNRHAWDAIQLMTRPAMQAESRDHAGTHSSHNSSRDPHSAMLQACRDLLPVDWNAYQAATAVPPGYVQSHRYPHGMDPRRHPIGGHPGQSGEIAAAPAWAARPTGVLRTIAIKMLRSTVQHLTQHTDSGTANNARTTGVEQKRSTRNSRNEPYGELYCRLPQVSSTNRLYQLESCRNLLFSPVLPCRLRRRLN
jgi:hypothetical protein